MRLLIADDEINLAKALQAVLEDAGYNCDVCFDGNSAIHLISQEMYDGLILVGGDTAVEVCRSLHTTQLLLLEEVQSGTPAGLLADGPLRGIPVVTKSGAFGDEDTLLHAWKYIRREGE